MMGASRPKQNSMETLSEWIGVNSSPQAFGLIRLPPTVLLSTTQLEQLRQEFRSAVLQSQILPLYHLPSWSVAELEPTSPSTAWHRAPLTVRMWCLRMAVRSLSLTLRLLPGLGHTRLRLVRLSIYKRSLLSRERLVLSPYRARRTT